MVITKVLFQRKRNPKGEESPRQQKITRSKTEEEGRRIFPIIPLMDCGKVMLAEEDGCGVESFWQMLHRGRELHQRRKIKQRKHTTAKTKTKTTGSTVEPHLINLLETESRHPPLCVNKWRPSLAPSFSAQVEICAGVQRELRIMGRNQRELTRFLSITRAQTQAALIKMCSRW